MILLDTDHLSVLKYPESPRHEKMTQRMESSPDKEFATTIVNIEEQMVGWQKFIGCARRAVRLRHMIGCWGYSSSSDIAQEFGHLRRLKIRLGSSDLKIASIALVQGATLLSANLRDFRKVPGLKVENWLD